VSDPTPTGATDLTIVIDDGAGARTTYHLTCEPPGGDHPRPEIACQVLADHGARALPPVPPEMRCTQIYGGPETALVSGTWRGEPVRSRLSRQNGCEIARWNALAGFLPRGGL
jgi:Subtilisin inhibitor-like